MKLLQTLAEAFQLVPITPRPGGQIAPYRPPGTASQSTAPSRSIPKLIAARGVEQCFRCGQRSSLEQLIYEYRGMYFGGDCIGRVLILELEHPGINTEALQQELIKDMKRFRALGLARSARRIMRENA
jgi:hypothetical protein